MAGWGCVDRDAGRCKVHDDGLKTADTQLMADADCTWLGVASVLQWCTVAPGHRSVMRQGDSGGPLMTNSAQGYRLVGVLSTVSPNDAAAFDVSARLQRTWIYRVTGMK